MLNYDLHWNPVRLIQRFGRVDRIGTEHEVINLHNMWPDVAVDAELSLTERLHRRIQSFHDLIGLDSKLLSDAERLNASAMYRIYDGKSLPEMDDGLDEVAANQRAITLLQRIQEDDPDLWQTITQLPDGIRSALPARIEQPSASNDQYAQSVLEVEGAQAPLMSPATMASVSSPFDDPRQGETLVLLSRWWREKLLCGQTVSCSHGPSAQRNLSPPPSAVPDMPARPLPADTNERVMSAFNAFSTDFQRRLGRARRPRDTRARRYVSRHLGFAMNEARDDVGLISRIDVLTSDIPGGGVAAGRKCLGRDQKSEA